MNDPENKVPDVYILLKFLSNKIDWVNLYNIYESLEDFAKKANYPLNCTKKDKEKLTKSANNFSIVGFNARHGYRYTPNLKNDGFNLKEAEEFVFEHVRNYLTWKKKLVIEQLEK